MDPDLLALLSMVAVMAISSAAIVRKTVRQRRDLEAAAAPENPAIPPVNMKKIRSDPERWLALLEGKVRSIHVVSAPEFGAGGEEGNSVLPRFIAFLIDTNGEPHDLADGRDEKPLEEDAAWLARELGVELDSRI